MIEINMKRGEDKKLVKLDKIRPGCWVDLVSPSDKEIEIVSRECNVERDMILSPLDEKESPRIEKEGNATLVIFRIPYKKVEMRTIKTLPMGIIVTEKNIITVSLHKNRTLLDFYEGNIKGFSTLKRNRFLLQILTNAMSYYIKYLQEIEDEMNAIEKRISRSLKNEEMMEFINIRRVLTYFNTSIVANDRVLQRILRGNVLKLYDEDEDVLEDIIIENDQARETVNILMNIVNSMMDTYSNVISNNLNAVMKFLTSITIILSLPTIISSIYGMNVGLPLQNNPFAFHIIILITLFVSVLSYMFFSKKGWI